MMHRTVLTLLLVGTLAACDSEPDPTFQKSVEDRQAERSGDPYDALSRPPRPSDYSRADAGQKMAVAASSAASLSGTIQSLWDKVAVDKDFAAKVKANPECQDAVKASAAFQASSEVGEAASKHAGEIYADLIQCREGAIEREKAGGGDAKLANIERRFASTSMSLVGMSLIAKGDAENGLKLWREGDERVVKDKPGFKLEFKSLRGY